MIEESYCSFDLAKKLFEKGLPQGLDSEFAYTVKECHSYADFSPLYKIGEEVWRDEGFKFDDIIIAPNLALVQKWLLQEKGIRIELQSTVDFDRCYYMIVKRKEDGYSETVYDSMTDDIAVEDDLALSAAIYKILELDLI
jgi:hypothetical protein